MTGGLAAVDVQDLASDVGQGLQEQHAVDDVTDLALALGFSSHSHFSAAFKQVYGQTPSAFRKLSRLH